MTPCTHGMPTPGSCVDCMAEGNLIPPPKPAPRAWSRSFDARYAGRCCICDDTIEPGDLIKLNSDQDAAHFACAEEDAGQ